MTRDIIPIFEKYDTDKGSKGHNYAPYYEKHLPKTAKKILEIGCYKGESIRCWHEIYPEAQIYTLDLFEENPIPFNEPWFHAFKGSQVDGDRLKQLRELGPYDFIVEDGSHNSRDQLITFYGLVDCSPLYIVEDLHCCKEEFYRQGMKFKNTMLGILQKAQFAEVLHAGMASKYYNFPFHLHDDKIAFIQCS